jgi:hypothetical protein
MTFTFYIELYIDNDDSIIQELKHNASESTILIEILLVLSVIDNVIFGE